MQTIEVTFGLLIYYTVLIYNFIILNNILVVKYVTVWHLLCVTKQLPMKMYISLKENGNCVTVSGNIVPDIYFMLNKWLSMRMDVSLKLGNCVTISRRNR